MYGIYESGQVIAEFVSPLTVRSNHPVLASDTLSLSRPIVRRSAQRWEIEANLMPLAAGAQELFVNLVTKGYNGTVDVVMPQNYGVILARTTNSAVTMSGALDGSTATIGSNTGLMPKGTFIKSAGTNKVYMTTTDRSGNGSVGIYPNFISTVSGTANCLDDVIGKFLWDLDMISGMRFSDGILMDMGTIRLVEKVP